MLKWILVMMTLAIFSACGDDWAAGDPSKADRFRGRFRYYYAESCRFDSFSLYDCEGAYSLNRPMAVSLYVEWDGYAVLDLDGDVFRYHERDYDEGHDGLSYYYQFYENDESVTLYTDGTELIYWDSKTRRATVYYDYLPY